MKQTTNTTEIKPGCYVEELTNREMDFVPLLIKGLKVIEIAKALTLARRTTEFHVDNMKSKLNCRTLYELGVRLAEMGFDDDDSDTQ